MRLPVFLTSISERVYLLCFTGIIFVATVAVYFVHQDSILLQKKILSKQNEISHLYALKAAYESKKQALEASAFKGITPKGLSLAAIEDIVSKNLIGGRLVALRPAAARTDKEKRQMVVEVRISGAPLGEVVAFLQAIDSAGFRPKKLQLSLPGTGQATLEMQASIVDGRVHD